MQKFVPVMKTLEGDMWSPGVLFSQQIPQFTVSANIVNLIYRNLYSEPARVAIMGDYSNMVNVKSMFSNMDSEEYDAFFSLSQEIQQDGSPYNLSRDFAQTLILKKRKGFLENCDRNEYVDLSEYTKIDELDPLVLLTTAALKEKDSTGPNGTWAFSILRFSFAKPNGTKVSPEGDINAILDMTDMTTTNGSN